MSGIVDMTVDLGGLAMRNPVTVASGTFGSGREYSEFVDLSRMGALTTKGVSPQPWSGNRSPRIAETPSGLLNSIGLQNPGVERFCEENLPWLADKDVPVIVNVSGHTVREYVEVIERLESESVVSAYELNISCPNVDAGGMTFGTDPHLAASVLAACRPLTSRPLLAKLTPNVTDITEIARAVESEGADALSLINTVLGMDIDVRSRRPKLGRIVGGLSGPAIRPIALRMVWETYRAVQVPLLGMGGIADAEDAVAFMLAGATGVAIGTANFVEPTTVTDVVTGIECYCIDQGVSDVKDLIGGLIC